VLAKALEKDPARRYETAAAFAAELRRVRAREPVRARRAGPLLRARRWCQRNPLGATLVAVLLTAAVSAWLLLLQVQGSLRRARAATLASFSREVGETDAVLGLLAALEAHAQAPGPEPVSAVLGALLRSHEVRRFDGHARAVWRVAFGPGGRKLVSGGLDWAGAARVWDVHGDRPPVVLPHGGCVYDVDVHGERFVTASAEDGRVRLWDFQGTQHGTLPVPARPEHFASMFLRARFSHDGARILALTQGGPAYLWTPATDAVLPLLGHGGMVFEGQFAPDDAVVATCVGYGTEMIPWSDDHTARLWRVSDGQQLAVCTGHTAPILWVEFAPDGRSLLTASQDGTIRVWDLAGRELRRLRGHRQGVRVARWHPDRPGVIASGSLDGDVRLWDAGGDTIATMSYGEPVWDLEFSRDGTRLLSASYGRTARLHDLHGRCLRVFRGHADKVMDATFSPDGRLVATGSFDGTVRLWRAEDDEFAVWHEHTGAIRSLACTDDGHVLSASADHTARLWHGASSTVLDAGFRVNRAACAPAGDVVLTAHDDQTLALWSTTGQRLGRWLASEQRLFVEQVGGWRSCTAVFLPDGRFVAAAQSRELRLFERDGRSTRLCPPASVTDHELLDLAVHPDGRRLVAGTSGGTLKLLDLHGRELWTGAPHTGYVARVEFTRDGTRLLSAAKDGTLILWDVRGDRLQQAHVLSHEAGLTWGTFARDGRHVLATAVDGTARLWTAAGVEVVTLRMADVPLTCGAFRADGSGFLVGTEHGLILACPMPERALALARQRATRALSDDERRRIERRLGR
jgi:WD40 repeat protein